MITNDVKRSVLKKIKPNKRDEDALNNKVQKLLDLLNKTIKDLEIDAELFVGGSYGKGTYLKDSSDVDIFCRFKKEYKNYNLGELLKKILEFSKFKYEVQKGSRNYFWIKYQGVDIEMVPVLEISSPEEAYNTTDISPLHVEFVNENTTEEIRDEIRLAKVFFKAKGLYGAESYKNSFSGHVIDILIIYYKSLENLIRNVKNWGYRKVIDVMDQYENEKEIFEVMDENKLGNLVVIDPIVRERNAASALSSHNYYKFVFICNETNVLSEQDFEIPDVRIYRYLRDRMKFGKDNNLFVYGFMFELSKGVNTEDIMGSKLLKLAKKLRKYYQDIGFRVFKLDFFFSYKEEKCFVLYHFESSLIPRIRLVKGPSIFLKKAVDKFKEKRGEVFQIEDHIYAYEKRSVWNVKDIYLGVEDFEKILGKELKFIRKVKILN